MDVIVFWISVVLIAVTLGIKTWLTKGQPITGWVRPNKDKQQREKIEEIQTLHSIIYFQSNPARRIADIDRVISAFKKQFN